MALPPKPHTRAKHRRLDELAKPVEKHAFDIGFEGWKLEPDYEKVKATIPKLEAALEALKKEFG